MKSGQPRPVPVRAREVLSYFLCNPHAADNLEGVARWRVPQEAVHFAVEQVSHALSWLVEQGFLLHEISTGMSRVFRLNHERTRDAELFVSDLLQHTYVDTDGTSTRASGLMVQAIAWLDATLVRYLRENPPRVGDQPGITRAHESIEAILTERNADKGADADAARQKADAAARALADACDDAGREPLAVIYHSLDLTWLELQAVLLCLAPELDADYQLAYGVLNDDMGRRAPTLGLICRMLGKPLAVRTELAASAGLTRWRLIESGSALPHGDEVVRLDASLVSWLLGVQEDLLQEPRVARCVRSSLWPGGAWLRRSEDLRHIQMLAERLSGGDSDQRWVALCGEDSDGWRALAEAAANEAGAALVRIVPPPPAVDIEDPEDSGIRIARAVILLAAAVVVDLGRGGAEGWGARLIGILSSVRRPRIVIVPELEQILGTLPRERCDVWTRSFPQPDALADAFLAATSEAGLYLSPSDAQQIAQAFPLSVSGIDNAVRLALLKAADRQPVSGHAAAITTACRRVASPELPRFARRVEPVFSLDDVVLPKDRLDQLREIVAHVKYASHVLNHWGFSGQLPYGRGVAALFCGPSGTGKTMAAQAIAHELQTETFVVDLSKIMSKFIGESEKFIDATFRDAQRAGAVMQIDEAEALFGKRSEIKDAHDRYANLEVAYLLQRMEAYEGVAILTTNFRQNLDPAFLRRLRFVVEFPKPDAAAREEIWLRCLPKDAPFHNVNVRFLARRLDLTGGHIRQITVRAAFAAAGQGSPMIEMRHLIEATRAELLKLGMPSAERELAEFEAAERRAGGLVA